MQKVSFIGSAWKPINDPQNLIDCLHGFRARMINLSFSLLTVSLLSTDHRIKNRMKTPLSLRMSAKHNFGMVLWIHREAVVSFSAFAATAIVFSLPLQAQDPDEVLDFDVSAEGDWSDLEKTTLVVPQVSDGGVNLDGSVSSAEYGGFEGVEVVPGVNAWILNFPGDRAWENPEDTSFTFWVAHDTDNLYIGVDAKDDVLNSDDEPAALWKDDSIEIVVDALNDDYDNNTDNSMDRFGGHCYASFDGRFSEWDDGVLGARWSSEVEWEFGEDKDIYTKGSEVAGGWQLELRFAKRLFEDPDAGNKLVEGYVMGFNIGMDDDDKQGPGPEGSGDREQDLELQYWWANRARLSGWNEVAAEDYTAEQIANGEHEKDFDPIIDGTGRLSHGGAGDLVFGGPGGAVLPFQITEISVVEMDGKSEATLVWPAKGSSTYTVERSSTLR